MTAEPTTRPAKVFYGVRLLSRREVDEDELPAWDELEARSIEPNVYLSPDFVLPAWDHLERGARIRLAVVERHGAGPIHWVGLAVLRRCRASMSVPWPHWEIHRFRHAVRGGVLLDARCADDAAKALLYALAGRAGWSGAAAFGHMLTEGVTRDIFARAAAALGYHWTVTRSDGPRAEVVVPAPNPLATRRSQQIDRSRQRLNQQGSWSWHVDRSVEHPEALNTFLRLDHQDWRRELGLSFLSSAEDERFFRDMVRRLSARGRVWMSELRFNGEPVAASCSLFSASGVGFAYRTGWVRSLGEPGVALVHEQALAEQACVELGPLALWDNAATGELLTDISWDNRVAYCDAVVTTGPVSRWLRAAAAGITRLLCWPMPGGAAATSDAGADLHTLSDRDLLLHAGRRWRTWRMSEPN